MRARASSIEVLLYVPLHCHAQAWTLTAVLKTPLLQIRLKLQKRLEQLPIILTDVQALELQNLGRQFLSLYQFLREWAIASNRAAYGVRPKLHYFAEMIEGLPSSRQNPRRQDLFNAESFLGKVKNVGRKVHRRKGWPFGRVGQTGSRCERNWPRHGRCPGLASAQWTVPSWVPPGGLGGAEGQLRGPRHEGTK